ncbi:MAG: hypothetical protein QJR02_07270 [Sinobacteraceae bacterium]|nr:hypothetical protein [Nevskiaceae bacterium]
MAFTTDQLAALEAALASGQLEFRFGDRWVKYQTIADLRAAYELVKAQLQSSGALPLTAGSNRGPATLATFSRE